MRLALVLAFAASLAAAQDGVLSGGEPAIPQGAIARLGRPPLQHHHESFLPGSVALSPDGRLVAAVTVETTRVWHVRTGALLRTLGAGRARSLAFGPAGRFLAVLGAAAEIVDLPRDVTVGSMDGALSTCAWSAEGTRVALGRPDGIEVRSWPGLQLEKKLSLDAEPEQIAFGPLGVTALLVDGSVRFGRIETGETMSVLVSQGTPAAIDSSGKLLAHARADGSIDVLDVWSGKAVAHLEGHPEHRVTVLAFAQNLARLASGDERGIVRTWLTNGETELPLVSFAAHAAPITGIAFEGSSIATTGEREEEIQVFSAATGLPARAGHRCKVSAVAYSPDGKWIVSGGVDGRVFVWSATTREPVTVASFAAEVRSLAVSSDSKRVALALKDTVTVADLATLAPAWSAKEEDDAALSVAFLAPDRVAVGLTKGSVALHDAASGKRVGTLTGGDGAARSIAASPDGALLVATNGVLTPASQTVNVWDVATGKRRALLHDGHVWTVGFLADGRTVFTSAWSEPGVRLWEGTTGKPLRGLEVRYPILAACSPDGALIATADDEKQLSVRKLATGEEVAVGVGHRAAITALAFAPSSRELASASEDGTLIIWDTTTGGTK